MSITDSEKLRRLGAGESIAAIIAADGTTCEEFDAWWDEQTQSRVPRMDGSRVADIASGVEIFRDEWGVPHILADDDTSLFFGYGYATAQDRLWQLDYYRRKALGNLSEVVGPEGVDIDITSRTIGIRRIAERGLPQVDSSTRRRLAAFSDGINALMEESRGNFPIEFDLLGYEPHPWSPLDSYAIWQEFRWYLTGRLPVIAIPELAKRVLGKGPLLDDFITGEAEEESVVPPGSYSPAASGIEKVGEVIGDPQDGLGSNNWVVDGSKSTNGKPMVASDPHIAFGAVSCWYEVHLSAPKINVVGAGYAGVPGVIFGRTEKVAWGVTNNICSQRDIYREEESPERPGWFKYDGDWEQAETATETIPVKAGDDVSLKVVRTRNGPIVTHLLPDALKQTGPVSVKWLGASHGDEITCLLNLATATTVDAARDALEPWVLPTWSLVFGDVDGHIRYQACGRIPVRNSWNRGYRPGWDPAHQWQGYIPFAALPALSDPSSGYARSANNRGAPEDYPYPLSGTWNSGNRARRIRQMLEEQPRLSREDFARMQTDTLSLRAVEALPNLLSILERSADDRVLEARRHLGGWDGRMDLDRVGATIFDTFFLHWTHAIACEKFSEAEAELVAAAIPGFGVRQLSDSPIPYFESITTRDQVVHASMGCALDELESRLGSDMSTWEWGRLHTLLLNHLLAGRGDVAKLLERGGQPVGGNGITVSNTGFDPNYLATIGANWRHNAELADNPPGLWAVDATGQSGHPGSRHYGDQFKEWRAGRQHYLPMDRERIETTAVTRFRLTPRK